MVSPDIVSRSYPLRGHAAVLAVAESRSGHEETPKWRFALNKWLFPRAQEAVSSASSPTLPRRANDTGPDYYHPRTISSVDHKDSAGPLTKLVLFRSDFAGIAHCSSATFQSLTLLLPAFLVGLEIARHAQINLRENNPGALRLAMSAGIATVRTAANRSCYSCRVLFLFLFSFIELGVTREEHCTSLQSAANSIARRENDNPETKDPIHLARITITHMNRDPKASDVSVLAKPDLRASLLVG